MYENNPEDTSRYVLFFHGKESGPFGTKYKWMQKQYEVDAPDFQGMDLQERLKVAEDYTKNMKDVFLVGSSYGGLLAALLYSKHPDRFSGYLLLAPALHLPESESVGRVPKYCAVIHSPTDEVVPISPVSKFCTTKGLPLILVEDTHALHDSESEVMDTLNMLFDRC